MQNIHTAELNNFQHVFISLDWKLIFGTHDQGHFDSFTRGSGSPSLAKCKNLCRDLTFVTSMGAQALLRRSRRRGKCPPFATALIEKITNGILCNRLQIPFSYTLKNELLMFYFMVWSQESSGRGCKWYPGMCLYVKEPRRDSTVSTRVQTYWSGTSRRPDPWRIIQGACLFHSLEGWLTGIQGNFEGNSPR